jgi:HK97 family phage prohead protease
VWEIDPAAIVGANADDVLARFEHNPMSLLGRTSNGTVRLSRDDQGLSYEIDVPNTSVGNDVLELVNRGDVRGSSFEIAGHRGRHFSRGRDRVYRITHITRLVDVAPVSDPAFAGTSVETYSRGDGSMPAPTTTEDPTAEPNAPPATPPPADPPAPRVTFSQPEPEDRLARFREYAADLTTPQIEGTIDSIRAAGITETNADQLEGFTAELRSRQRTDTAARQRMEHLQQLADLARGVVPAPPSAHELFASDDYAHAFGNYLRTGDKNGMAQFAQSIAGTGAEGGYTVPDEFRTKITETMAAYGGIQQAAEVLETPDGRSLPWPTNNDTANSAVVATEGAAPGSAGADLVFGEVNLGAFSIAATGTSNAPLKVSWELLQDSAFDFAGFVSRKLGERLGRKAAAYYATGVGTTEPFGLLA